MKSAYWKAKVKTFSPASRKSKSNLTVKSNIPQHWRTCSLTKGNFKKINISYFIRKTSLLSMQIINQAFLGAFVINKLGGKVWFLAVLLNQRRFCSQRTFGDVWTRFWLVQLAGKWETRDAAKSTEKRRTAPSQPRLTCHQLSPVPLLGNPV